MIDGKKSVLVINGPNLNLLGVREPHIYGYDTLADVESAGKKLAAAAGAEVDFFQSNWEGAVLERIHQSRTDGTDAIIINPAGWTHHGVPLRDALLGVDIPFIELHIGNLIGREEWRHNSKFRDKATCIIMGFGVKGYQYALDMAIESDAKFPRRAEPSQA